MQRVILKKPVGDIDRGEIVIIEFTGAGHHVYHYTHHCDLRRMYRFAIPSSESGHYEKENDWYLPSEDDVIRDYERPNYLHPYFVPGPFFMGHHLYLDDIWLAKSGNEKHLDQVLALCKKETSYQFHQYKFFEWFATHWPEGLFLVDLKKLSDSNQIPQ